MAGQPLCKCNFNLLEGRGIESFKASSMNHMQKLLPRKQQEKEHALSIKERFTLLDWKVFERCQISSCPYSRLAY